MCTLLQCDKHASAFLPYSVRSNTRSGHTYTSNTWLHCDTLCMVQKTSIKTATQYTRIQQLQQNIQHNIILHANADKSTQYSGLQMEPYFYTPAFSVPAPAGSQPPDDATRQPACTSLSPHPV